jgi:hypothetical protein
MFALFAVTSSASPAAEVGVSISLGQPGFYGQIDIGDYPPPRLIYAEPVIVEQVVIVPQPIYLHVQYDHIKHWDKHCHEYGACGQRVYFVDGWYTVYGRIPQEAWQEGQEQRSRALRARARPDHSNTTRTNVPIWTVSAEFRHKPSSE